MDADGIIAGGVLSDVERSRRTWLVVAIMLIGLATLIPYGTISLTRGREAMGAAELGIAVLFAVSLFRLRKGAGAKGICALVTGVLGVFFLYLILFGGVEHSVWAFVFPLLALFLLGLRVGGAAIALFLAAVVIFFAVSPGEPFEAYSPGFKSRYIGAHVVVFLGAFMFEMTRLRFHREAGLRNEELRRALEELGLAAAALRESESKYRDLVDRANDGIVIVHEEVIRFANLRIAAILGVPVSSIVGRPVREFIHPSCLAKTMRQYSARMARRPADTVYESALLSPDGRRIDVELNSGIIPFDGGQAALVFVRDITEQKRSTAERERLRSQLQQVQKMEAIGSLAGGIAHDFNNLLGGITGHAELILLNSGNEGSRTSEYARSIRKTARRAADLTAKLLAFARKGRYEVVRFDLRSVVRDVVGLLERTIHKRISLETAFGDFDHTVSADRSQIESAVLNLALNGRDAMPNGGMLRFATEAASVVAGRPVEQCPDLAPGQYIRLTVSDTGVGMDEETLRRIFEPFFTTKEEGKGTGLGLASVYGTVMAHEGAVFVRSEPRQGTEFEIYLPASPGLVEITPDPGADPDPGGGRILIIDDETVVREVCSSMLEECGFSVVSRDDGQQGVEYFRQNHQSTDLVLLDLVMPGIGGLDCFRRLREISDTVSVVVMSGYAREEEAREVLRAGAKGFLAKPFSMDELAKAVGAALRNRGRGESRPVAAPS